MCEFVGQENKGLEQQEEWWRAPAAAMQVPSTFLTPHVHPGHSAPQIMQKNIPWGVPLTSCFVW